MLIFGWVWHLARNKLSTTTQKKKKCQSQNIMAYIISKEEWIVNHYSKEKKRQKIWLILKPVRGNYSINLFLMLLVELRAQSMLARQPCLYKNKNPRFKLCFIYDYIYSEIPLLRPPKIKTSYLLKTLFAKFKLFFIHFLHPVYLWLVTTFGTGPKVVFKTTFGQSQRWS